MKTYAAKSPAGKIDARTLRFNAYGSRMEAARVNSVRWRTLRTKGWTVVPVTLVETRMLVP